MKRFLEDAIAADHSYLFAFGIAIATGFGFVYSAHAIDRHFQIRDCTIAAIERGIYAPIAHDACIVEFETRHN